MGRGCFCSVIASAPSQHTSPIEPELYPPPIHPCPGVCHAPWCCFGNWASLAAGNGQRAGSSFRSFPSSFPRSVPSSITNQPFTPLSLIPTRSFLLHTLVPPCCASLQKRFRHGRPLFIFLRFLSPPFQARASRRHPRRTHAPTASHSTNPPPD